MTHSINLLGSWVVISGGFSPSRAPAILPLRSEGPANTLARHRAEVYKDQPPAKPRRALTSSHGEGTAVGQPQALAPSFVTRTSPALIVLSEFGTLSKTILGVSIPIFNLMLTFWIAGTPDWTVPNPEGELSPHVIFARSVDWSVTPLGDMSSWNR